MSENALTTLNAAEAGAVLEAVVIEGDLARLSPQERVGYYRQVCNSVGLNPMTRPFDYIKLNGKLTLYAKRDAADQLRQIHGVSVKLISKDVEDGLLVVHVAAEDKHGRRDEDIGAVQVAGLKGEARANAMAKAMTKAKRRVTLSICGLGWLDESEVADNPGAVSPSLGLDALFPTETPAPEKSEPVGSPPDAVEGIPEPDGTAETPNVAVGAPKELLGAIPLFLGDETYYLEDAKAWYSEFRKQLDFTKRNEELGTYRERMTALKELEQANAEGLDTIPAAGKEELKKFRTKLNRALGAEAKELEANG